MRDAARVLRRFLSQAWCSLQQLASVIHAVSIWGLERSIDLAAHAVVSEVYHIIIS